jgi:hypothetical protein
MICEHARDSILGNGASSRRAMPSLPHRDDESDRAPSLASQLCLTTGLDVGGSRAGTLPSSSDPTARNWPQRVLWTVYSSPPLRFGGENERDSDPVRAVLIWFVQVLQTGEAPLPPAAFAELDSEEIQVSKA